MTVDQVFIIKKLQNLDEMLVAYSAVTRMPKKVIKFSVNQLILLFAMQDHSAPQNRFSTDCFDS